MFELFYLHILQGCDILIQQYVRGDAHARMGF